MAGAPLRQSAVPLALAATTLMTQTLVGVLAEFGIGSGWPDRQPAFVHFSKEHTAVVQVTAREAPTRPPQRRLVKVVPAVVSAVPQFPVPMPVVKLSWLGCGLKPQQPARVVLVDVLVDVEVDVLVELVVTGALVEVDVLVELVVTGALVEVDVLVEDVVTGPLVEVDVLVEDVVTGPLIEVEGLVEDVVAGRIVEV